MTQWEKANELEEVETMAVKADSVLLTISEAMYAGSYSLEEYRGALAALADITDGIKRKLSEMTRRAFEEIEKEQEEM